MPAFQLSAVAAALVSDTQPPCVTIVHLSSQGIVVYGKEAIEQLMFACKLVLDADANRPVNLDKEQAR